MHTHALPNGSTHLAWSIPPRICHEQQTPAPIDVRNGGESVKWLRRKPDYTMEYAYIEFMATMIV